MQGGLEFWEIFSLGNVRNIAFWVVLFVLVLALFNLFSGSGSTMQSRERTFPILSALLKTAMSAL